MPAQRYSVWCWKLAAYLALLPAGLFYLLGMLDRRYRDIARKKLVCYRAHEQAPLRQRKVIWLHAAASGELLAALPLLRRLKLEYCDYAIVCSTGSREAYRLAGSWHAIDLVTVLPLDVPILCRRALNIIQPELVIMLETEIWPNFILALSARHIPLYLVNARLDERAWRHYLLLKPLFAPLLQRYRAIAVQTADDAERFRRLGAPPQRLQLAGQLKFEAARLQVNQTARAGWQTLLQLPNDVLVLLGGSTVAGEETLLIEIYAELLRQGLLVRLILAPRRTGRTAAIWRELSGRNIPVIRRSQIAEQGIPPQAVIIIDTIGELAQLYAAADIVFIGKSLCGRGGHNPLEAAAWGKAIVFGPHMRNFSRVAAQLMDNDAAIMIADSRQLTATISQLARQPQRRLRLGANARYTVQSNQGALENILALLAGDLARSDQCGRISV